MRVGTARDRFTTAQVLQQAVLPHYVLERQEKLRCFSESAAQGPYHDMETSVTKLQGVEGSIRLCVDMIEGSVLALGVQTAHYLISNLNEAHEVIRMVEARWRESTRARREEAHMQVELLESLVHSHNSLRERSEAAEKEVKRLAEERDKKDAAADRAIQYIHSVIAERAVWQERHGHNSLDLPLEETTFSEMAVSALDILEHVRRLRLDSASPPENTAVGNNTFNMQLPSSPRRPRATRETGSVIATAALPSRSESTLPSVRPAAASVSPPRESCSASRVQHTFLSSWFPPNGGATGGATPPTKENLILARIRSIEDTRHSAIVPSCRLHYIPPHKEVELLREVLAMGTGSTTLVTDIEAAHAGLNRRKAQLREECAAMRRAMGSLRRELNNLRRYMQDLVSQGLPFLAVREDLLQPLNRRIEHEAREMAQLWIADMAVDVEAAAHGRYATANIGPRLLGMSGEETGEGDSGTVSEPFGDGDGDGGAVATSEEKDEVGGTLPTSFTGSTSSMKQQSYRSQTTAANPFAAAASKGGGAATAAAAVAGVSGSSVVSSRNMMSPLSPVAAAKHSGAASTRTTEDEKR